MPRRTDLVPVPPTVNGYPVVASKPATLSDREICDIILCRRGVNYYVTWCYNRQCPGASSGHYDMSLASAAADFTNRGTF